MRLNVGLGIDCQETNWSEVMNPIPIAFPNYAAAVGKTVSVTVPANCKLPGDGSAVQISGVPAVNPVNTRIYHGATQLYAITVYAGSTAPYVVGHGSATVLNGGVDILQLKYEAGLTAGEAQKVGITLVPVRA